MKLYNVKCSLQKARIPDAGILFLLYCGFYVWNPFVSICKGSL